MSKRAFAVLNHFIFIALIIWSVPAHALSVDALRFGDHIDKTRMVIELDESVEFKAFVLDNPHRVVIDLPSFSWNVGSISKPKSGGVREIRHGSQGAQLSRLVIDIAHPALIRSAFLLPKTADKSHRLVIDFEKVSAQSFASKKDRIFGNLKSDIAPQTPKTISNLVTRTQKQTQPSQTTAAKSANPIVTPSKKPQPPQGYTPSPIKRATKPTIVLDPGHGGVDPGAIGSNKSKEKDVTFATAKELKKQLEATGLYKVYLTRNSDKYIKLHKRVAIARAKDADLFMSIHADSINKPNVRGASVYTLSDKASDKQTARLAARENQADLIAGVDLSHEDKEVANILLDLSMRDTMNQSKFLANTLVSTMGARGMKLLTRPHRYAGFAVLKAPDVPSVLVEVGFISNSREAQMLNTSSYRRKVSASLVDGINAYFSKVRKNNNAE